MKDYIELIYDNKNEMKIDMIINLLNDHDIKCIHQSEGKKPRKVAVLIKNDDYDKAVELLKSNKVILDFNPQNNNKLRILGIAILIVTILVIIFSIYNMLN